MRATLLVEAPPADQQKTPALVCRHAGPDCQGAVQRRWVEPEQIFTYVECDWHYAERLREQAALLDRLRACRPEAPQAPTADAEQRREPQPGGTPSRTEEDEASAPAPQEVRPWPAILPPVDTSLGEGQGV